MKLFLRIFAVSIVIGGAAAASVHPSSSRFQASHQAAPSFLPTPQCGPHMPTCPPEGK